MYTAHSFRLCIHIDFLAYSWRINTQFMLVNTMTLLGLKEQQEYLEDERYEWWDRGWAYRKMWWDSGPDAVVCTCATNMDDSCPATKCLSVFSSTPLSNIGPHRTVPRYEPI